jgi:hypothetical protein
MANLDAISVIIGGLLHGGEQGHFEQPLLAGLSLTGETNRHESDFRLESLGDTLARAHFGHNPSVTLFGEGPGPETVFAGLFTHGSDSALIVTSGETPVLTALFGEHPHIDILGLFDTDNVI